MVSLIVEFTILAEQIWQAKTVFAELAPCYPWKFTYIFFIGVPDDAAAGGICSENAITKAERGQEASLGPKI